MSDRTESAGQAAQSPGLQAGSLMESAVGAGSHLAPVGTFDSGDPAVHCAVYAPSTYELGYAYPLIVWFHDVGGDERDVLNWLPHLSDRNYVGIGLRAPVPLANGLPGQRRWATTEHALDRLEDELAVSLRDVSERMNVHGGRVAVAGVGQGATIALRMLLRRPEWFAAGVCLNADWLPANRVDWWGQYANKPLWLGHTNDWALPTSRSAIHSAKLLMSAGFDVTPHFDDWDELRPAALAREVNHWLMHALCGESVIV